MAPEAVNQIKDMCYVARGGFDQPFIGSLSNGPENHLLLRSDDHQSERNETFEVQTLDTFLESTPRIGQRLKVGLQLIQTVLALGVCPWVPETWSQTEVLLIRNPDSAIPTPYISHQSIRNTLKGKQKVQPCIQARSSLFALGVLLLELLFRIQLESLPLRNEYVGAAGQALQIADLCTVIQWQKSVEGQFGDKVADAIRRCILCAFEAQPDLSDSAFIRAVCASVLQPLEEFLSAWISE